MALIKTISDDPITAIALLPGMYQQLIECKQHIAKHSISYLSVAGDYVSEKLHHEVESLFKKPLLIGIGMTEVYGYAQNIYPHRYAATVFKEIKIKIKAADHEGFGEIMIASRMNPIGCHGEWIATGDIGNFNKKNRQLTLRGRVKDIIIKGGSNISPAEIEFYLLKYHMIDKCIVIGHDTVRGQKIVAFIVSRIDLTNNLEDINYFLSTYIARYKLLDKIYCINEIPTTLSGKYDRKLLQDWGH